MVGGGQAYSSGGRGGGFLREVRGGSRLYFMRVKLLFIYYESKTFYGAYYMKVIQQFRGENEI